MASPSVDPTRERIRPLDVGVGVALAAFCVLVGLKQPHTFPAARDADVEQAVIIAITCLALVVRRPAPAVSVLVSGAGLALYLGRSYTGGPVLLVPVLAMFLAGYQLTRRTIWQLSVAFAALLAVAVAASAAPAVQSWVWLIAWPPMVAGAGSAGAARRRHELDLAAQREEADRRQHAEARQQLAEARVQTAREVHDVVGHSLASITLLAGAGSRRVDADPAAAKEVLEEIRALSATALSDVRQALAAMNDPTQAIRDRSDASMVRLVDRLRRVGLRIDEQIDVELHDLEAPVALALHRIAQESLTNVMRHAGSLHASIGVRRVGGGVEMTIVDRGAPGGEIREGIGISGMRRRAEELGGQLSVGWGGDGEGLRVVTWIPATPVAAPAVSDR